MTNLTMFIIAISKDPKNFTKGFPDFPILLKIAPRTKAKTITPKTFIPSRFIITGVRRTLDFISK